MRPPPFAQPGQILDEKYRIVRVLGAGAMGLVVEAEHLILKAPVAVKFLYSASGERNREHEERFLREANITAELADLHVTRIRDLGRTAEDVPYIVMEFLDGEDLGAYLKRNGPLPVEEAVGYILQACEGIALAHAAGVIHRDVKPSNLFRTTDAARRPLIKVTDFGVAKKVEGDVALTKTGAALGSPLYMAPEQMRGSRDIDARVDIWALGVTLYQLLTGAVPFCGETLTEVCTRVVMDPPTPIAQHRPDVPGGLAAIIEQCFQKDRTLRWPSVTSFAAALAPYGPAEAWLNVERAAGVQKIAAEPSRPTAELPRPTERALAEAVKETNPGVALPPELRAAGARRARSPVVLAVMGVLVIGAPVALLLGLRARAGEQVGARGGASASASTIATATGTASTTATATATATATGTATATAIATASATATTTATPTASTTTPVIPTASTRAHVVPHATATPRPASTVLGGARR